LDQRCWPYSVIDFIEWEAKELLEWRFSIDVMFGVYMRETRALMPEMGQGSLKRSSGVML